MSMAGKISGFRETTLENVTTGAGVLVKNIDMTGTLDLATMDVISATAGGSTCTIEYPDAWDREIDGLPANTVGLREQEFVKPTVKATLIEVANEEVLASALGAATVTASPTGVTGYKLVEPKNEIEESDYLQNIALITQKKGGEPLIIVIDNPLSTEGFEFATEAKAGGGIEVTYTGNFEGTQLNKVPVHFYVPVTA